MFLPHLIVSVMRRANTERTKSPFVKGSGGTWTGALLVSAKCVVLSPLNIGGLDAESPLARVDTSVIDRSNHINLTIFLSLS